MKRVALIKNDKGEVLFEKEVEFPSNWSDNAVSIVASKYLFKTETSLDELVDRVVDYIYQRGIELGYDKLINDGWRGRLKRYVKNQIFAFNSPVWFNVGLSKYGLKGSTLYNIKGEEVDGYKYPQISACFIIPIYDTMESIMGAVSTSAILFKYGSGVGADWSKLRSKYDFLSTGGRPSGAVSFMKLQDAVGGVVKSGGKTRRAAIMQTLRVWHPDIEEFIEIKMREEKKALALIRQGYDSSFNGEAYSTVAFQNVNQSVRVTDDFMEKVISRDDYPLRSPHTGEAIKYVNAYDIITKIAEATYFCGDPALQFEDEMWRMCPTKNYGEYNSTNPCSEFVYHDNTSCNLASINLLKFLDKDGNFMFDAFRQTVRDVVLALDILVSLGGYPTRDIGVSTGDTRPIGLGYTNLGALLMTLGKPYNSTDIVSKITAVMNSEAIKMSSDIAKVMGSFPAFEDNKAHVAEVIESFMLSENGEYYHGLISKVLKDGLRNAQHTLLAPTGTISFMMDCVTTGIEPELSLIKYKLLAGEGDGVIKIVNPLVPRVLRKLGYDESEIEDIVEYVEENNTMADFPHCKDPAHMDIFRTSFDSANRIPWEWHVDVMAAAQPHLSGAISKTVNVPEDTTVDQIRDIYIYAWRKKLKAIAIYRDNSKGSQPLSVKRDPESKSMETQSTPKVVLDIEEKCNFCGSTELVQSGSCKTCAVCGETTSCG